MQGTTHTSSNTSPGTHSDPESMLVLIAIEYDHINLRNDGIVGD